MQPAIHILTEGEGPGFNLQNFLFRGDVAIKIVEIDRLIFG